MDFLHFSDRFTKNQDEPIPPKAMHVARCFKEEGSGFPTMTGCSLPQIMTQHHIHVPGNVVKDFFVRCKPLDNGQYILFMTGQYGNLTSFPSLALF